jgi:NAD(P)H-hydrate epimerase
VTVRVVTAKEAAARDRTTIESGVPSRQLMQRAGEAAAKIILNSFAPDIARRAVVFTGPGNNGGDGWVVAREIADAVGSVDVVEAIPPKTEDAAAERTEAMRKSGVHIIARAEGARLVIDALLGTGSSGAPRGPIADRVAEISALRKTGAKVVALDLPTGVDATTGEHEVAVTADLTVTFGNVKRGHLLARDLCGEILALEIGLLSPATDDAPELIDYEWVRSRLPKLRYDDNKGDRGKLAVVAGGEGMPGAAILVARAALRSGIGLVRLLVHESNLPAVANAVPSALLAKWPDTPGEMKKLIGDWADALVIGPGIGNDSDSRSLVESILSTTRMPAVLDADALNVFSGDTRSLASLLRERMALITPHPAELGRLITAPTTDVVSRRFEIGVEAARSVGAVTLLKGSPTVISAINGATYCSARGSSALATGGSGDLLAGIAGALLAQTKDAVASACCAAWVHGRAAELCEYVRGTTLEDVLFALPRAWNEPELPLQKPVLARIAQVATE